MRSETEIRRQVEARFRRWGGLFLHGGLWFVAGLGLYFIATYWGFSGRFANFAIFFMFAWFGLVLLHLGRTIYVELREAAVRRAIERERQFFVQHGTYEKPKRLELAEDGELIDLPDEEEYSHAQRNRNS